MGWRACFCEKFLTEAGHILKSSPVWSRKSYWKNASLFAGCAALIGNTLITALYRMQRSREGLEQTDACVFPVTPNNVQTWLDIYNERMADVPNAAHMDSADGRELLKTGDGYFIHRDGQLLGIGKAADDFIDTVIAVQPGMGETVVLALASLLTENTVKLMVAGANTKAVRLYERMGFVKVKELTRWYRVL